MNQKQDAIIAEWCEPKPEIRRDEHGWIVSDGLMSPRKSWHVFGSKLEDYEKVPIWSPAPFSSDRNAMARALEVVRERGRGQEYADLLALLLVENGLQPPDNMGALAGVCFAFATATAAQRAEALVRMIQEKER